MLNVVLVLMASLVAVVAGVRILGSYSWKLRTQEMRSRLDAARVLVRPQTVNFCELEGLPAPVQRFFRTVLTEGQPMVAGVQLRHCGTFNIGEAAEQWKPFTSDQRVGTQRPGFDWDGRIEMMSGLHIHVHDGYIAGEGLLHASLFGLFPLADVRGTDDLAEGELMRFFAEATWYPTVLLPSQGVSWEAVNDCSAYATLTEGAISVTMLFVFNDSGLIESVRAEKRGRLVNGKMVPTPWKGRFWNCSERDGMRVPLDGEVAWLFLANEKPYWRGRITEIAYEFTE